jgi:hypothetical protein
VSFYGWPNADKFLTAYRVAGFRVAGHFVFPKRYTSKTRFVRYQPECAHLLVKGTPWLRDENAIGDVIDWTYSGNKLHPTQKPISVLMQLIEAFSSLGDLVLDPFAASGSTLAAARMLGRCWLGVEIDEKYHEIAIKRMGLALLPHAPHGDRCNAPPQGARYIMPVTKLPPDTVTIKAAFGSDIHAKGRIHARASGTPW